MEEDSLQSSEAESKRLAEENASIAQEEQSNAQEQAEAQRQAEQSSLAESQSRAQEQANQESQAAEQSANDEASGGNSYTVQAGDNLYRIAVNHGMSLDELLELNGLSAGANIGPGTTLKVN